MSGSVESGGAKASTAAGAGAAARPLAGLTVLDFGQGVAGPYCGQLLGDHGADVIKVEPPRGDWARTMGAQDGSGLSGTFVSVNRNKRSLCLDLKHPQAIDVVRSLARRCDVVVESFRVGVMDRMGLGYAALAQANPRLVYCAVTGFGETGPNVDLPAGDSTMQAYGGLMSVVGERDRAPLRVGNVVSDMLAGTNAFSGVLLALLQRVTSGRGQRVGVSLLDSIVAFQAPTLTEYLLTGTAPRRNGNEHPLVMPSGAVKTADGALMLTVLDHQWPRFCEVMQLPALRADPRFADAGARQRHRQELMQALEQVFVARPTREWLPRLRALDVMCAPINDYPALVVDPQVRHNALVGDVVAPDGRRLPSIANPVRLAGGGAAAAVAPSAASAAPPAPATDRAPPRLGEHTREVLADVLGLTADHVAELIARGVAVAP